jgi:prophage regulatory protein
MHTTKTPPTLVVERLLRLRDIVGPNGLLPIARSTWLAGVKDGRYPKPTMLGPRIPVWRYSEIAELFAAQAKS